MSHSIKLKNGRRTFSVISNFHEQEVYAPIRRWNRVIFLIHGFPDDNTSFSKVIPILEENFPKALILAPLLRGYEESSQGPEGEYTVGEIAKDVKSWINEVLPVKNLPVHLVGHDWGAIIAFKVASVYPELVDSMVTLAIPYLSNLRIWEYLLKIPLQLYKSSYFLTMQSEYLYKKLRQTGEDTYLDYLWRYWSPNYEYSRQEIDQVRSTLLKPGVLEASTAYYRCLFKILNFDGRRWNVNFEQVPTLILGGETDGCMIKSVYDLEAEKLAQTKLVKVQTMNRVGHFLHREDPVKVAEAIVEWIRYNK